MKRIYAKHLPYTNGHYGKVFDEMEITGEPTIRVIDYKGKLCAIEGSHRLAACHEQGMIPKIVILKMDIEMDMEDHWDRVVDTLPFYDFSHAYTLDMREVMKKHESRATTKAL